MIKEFIKACILVASLVFILSTTRKIIEESKIGEKITVIECKLLNRDVKIATYEVKVFISVFDCGDHGILISSNKEIFRKARENNKLTGYFDKHYYKIFDIKPMQN